MERSRNHQGVHKSSEGGQASKIILEIGSISNLKNEHPIAFATVNIATFSSSPSVNREHISSPESEQRPHAISGKILIFEDGGQVAAQEIITSMKQRELVSPIIVQCSNRSRGVCGLLGLCSVYLFMPILRQGLFVRRTKILISVGK